MIYWIVTPKQTARGTTRYFRGVTTCFSSGPGSHEYQDAYLHICPNEVTEYYDVVSVPEALVPEFEEFLTSLAVEGTEVIVLGRS